MKTPPRKRKQPTGTPQPRRLKKSQKGRLKFQPGDSHSLDDQLKEARNYRFLITEQISRLEQLQAAPDLSRLREQINQEDEALKAFLWEKYNDHKHRDHILATFLIARRKRRLERLQAAETALRLAGEFLTPDNTLLEELQQVIEQAPTKEELDKSGINHRRIGGVGTTKARLITFDEEVSQMRAAVMSSTGWFEWFWIEKQRLTREARQYLKKGKEIPEHIALFEPVIYGPYLKYRWREEGSAKAPIYTIQMSLADESPAEEDEERPLWPNL